MKESTKTLAGMGVLTAIVIVLQAMAIGIRFGVFNISLVLAPIVIGAALYGKKAGAWLGFVFSFVVLFTDAGAFLAVSIPGTIITVIAKGTLAGLCAAIAYKALESKSQWLAVIVAAIVCPVVNTGIFLIGCRLFFYETICGWATAAGFANAGAYMILGLVGVNFIVEMVINLVLATAIVRIINIVRKN